MRIKKRIRIIDTDAFFVVSKDYRDAVTEGQHDDPRRSDARPYDLQHNAHTPIEHSPDERARPTPVDRNGLLCGKRLK